MFDTYRIGGGHSTVSEHRDIHEHRAPTDDSVRLYQENVERARQEVLKALALQNSVLNVRIVHLKDPGALDEKLWLSFDLNGKNYTDQIPISFIHRQMFDHMDFYQAIADSVSKAISRLILVELVREIRK